MTAKRKATVSRATLERLIDAPDDPEELLKILELSPVEIAAYIDELEPEQRGHAYTLMRAAISEVHKRPGDADGRMTSVVATRRGGFPRLFGEYLRRSLLEKGVASSRLEKGGRFKVDTTVVTAFS